MQYREIVKLNQQIEELSEIVGAQNVILQK